MARCNPPVGDHELRRQRDGRFETRRCGRSQSGRQGPMTDDGRRLEDSERHAGDRGGRLRPGTSDVRAAPGWSGGDGRLARTAQRDGAGRGQGHRRQGSFAMPKGTFNHRSTTPNRWCTPRTCPRCCGCTANFFRARCGRSPNRQAKWAKPSARLRSTPLCPRPEGTFSAPENFGSGRDKEFLIMEFPLRCTKTTRYSSTRGCYLPGAVPLRDPK